MTPARTLIASSVLLAAVAGSAAAAPASDLVGPEGSLAGDGTLTHQPAPQAPPPIDADVSGTEETVPVAVGSATVYAETADQVADVEWALERFASAGLDLPDIEIHMYADRVGCAAPDGRLRSGYLGLGSGGYFLYVCGNRSVLLHELGHVWDNHALDDRRRAEFIQIRGLESWRHDVWREAAGEHLAAIIAWGLGGGRPMRFDENTDEALASAYTLVTGQQPRTLTDRGLVMTPDGVRYAARPAAETSFGSGPGSPL